MSQVDNVSSHTITTLENHVTIRHYTDQEITDEMLLKLINTARRSPTSSNMQAYSFVIVKNQKKKEKLSILAGDQQHIQSCGAFIAICADISRMEKATLLHGKELAKNLENTLVATVDAALVGMSLAISAESIGLGHCMIGGIRNNPKKVAEVLKLPKGVYVVYGMTLGWPERKKIPPQKPRLPSEAVIHWEEYNDKNIESYLKEYDISLSKHYRSLGRNTPDAAFTGIIARKFSEPRRNHLRQELIDLGFSLDLILQTDSKIINHFLKEKINPRYHLMSSFIFSVGIFVIFHFENDNKCLWLIN